MGARLSSEPLRLPRCACPQGKRIWDGDPALHAKVPDLNALSALSESQLSGEIGAEKAGPRHRLFARASGPDRREDARASPLCAGNSMLPSPPIAPETARRRSGSPCPPISTVSSRSSRCSARATRPCWPRSNNGWASFAQASRPTAIHRRSQAASRTSKTWSMKPKPRWRPIKPAMLPRFSEHSRSSCGRASKPC